MSYFYQHKNLISFRKIDRCDLTKLLQMLNATWAGRHNVPFMNTLDQDKWFERVTADDRKMFLMASGLVFHGDGKPVREIVGLYKIQNIDWINRTADIGRDIFPEHQGKGFGTSVLDAGNDFAFEMLGLNRLDTEILVTNTAAHAIALKCGFVEEGLRREAIYRGGKWVDSRFYGMLRSDWDALERVKAYSGICNLDMSSV